MEWNLKSPPPTGSWDFTEFSNLDNVNNNNASPNSLFGDEFSVDLKLGRVGNSGNEVPKAPAVTSSQSGSLKRTRGSYNGSQAVSCLVDGCNADLSACRDYHRRHKVCELHSKTSQVTIGGHKQRFCQQCSRFHALEEFDEGKRSCRKRLDGHNRRRRKPQPEPFSRYGTLLSNYHQGSQLLPFSSSLMYPSTAVSNPSWSNVVVKTEPDSVLQNGLFLNHPSSHSIATKPFTLFQGQSAHDLSPPLLRAFPVAETASVADRSSIGKLAFYEKSTAPLMQLQSSECALSLLSSTSETGLGHNNNNNNTTTNNTNNYIDMSDQLGSIPLVHAMGSLHCPPGMFHYHHHDHHNHHQHHDQLLGCDESSSTTNNHDSDDHHHHHQTLPSHWG